MIARTKSFAVVALVALGMLAPSAVGTAAELPPSTVTATLAYADQKLAADYSALKVGTYPVRTNPNGTWFTAGAADWTSGFYPGAIWLEYARNQSTAWRDAARAWQAPIEARKTDTSSHDIGFQIMNTFGKDAQLTGSASAKQVVLTAAASLAQRYDPKVGMFRSWGATTDRSSYQVIMDNMMNLELMFWASQNGGKPEWAAMARSHAARTMTDFFRPDGGSWHVVNYNQATGAVVSKYTAQGYSNDSTWSRGEAWAIDGFTTSYRYTGDTRFLDTARRSADYFLAHLPADKVPYWDFSLPSTAGQPRDTSAAAIAASGMIDLAGQLSDATAKARYLDGARDILASLSSPAYLSKGTSNQAILLHGTQNKPSGSYDTGIMFGDYYFIEALGRYQKARP